MIYLGNKACILKCNSKSLSFAVSISNVIHLRSLMKKTFYTEMAYAIGIVALALGTAFMEKADFGMSMVVAPAYLTYLKVSEYVSWFSFGMAEYCLQAVLIIILAIILRHFKRKYIFHSLQHSYMEMCWI